MLTIESAPGSHEAWAAPSHLRSGRIWAPLAVTVGAAVLVICLRILLDPWLGTRLAYSVTYPAILVITLVWGWRYGLLCAAVAYIQAAYRIAPPHFSFAVPDVGEAVRIAVTIINTTLILAIAHGFRSRRLEAVAVSAELRRLNRELWLAEEKYRLAFNEDAVARAIIDPADRRIDHANRTLARLSARQPEALEGRLIADLIHPDDRAAFDAWLDDPSPGEVEVECRLAPPAPEETWVSCRSAVFAVPNGDVPRLLVSCPDITLRRRAERAARQNDARFRALLDHATIGVVECDAQGRFLLANSRFCEIVGRTEQELRALTLSQIIAPEDLARNPQLGLLPLQDHALSLEQRLVRPDSTRVWVAMSIAAVNAEAGQPARSVVVAQDITDRKHWEKGLERRGEELAQSVRTRTEELLVAQRRQQVAERLSAVGTIASGIAHDVRNLLAALNARLDALDASGLPGTALDEVVAIRRIADQLQHLTAGLRLLALDPGSPLVGGETDIKAWMTEIEPVLRLVVQPPLELRTRIDDGLPVARISPPALAQAAMNLVQNAAEALRGAPGGQIVVSARAGEEGGVHLAVSDNGPGMSEEVRRRCIEPLFTTKPNGTGLGLALVSELAQRFGGRLTVSSEEEEGSTFVLSLQDARGPAASWSGVSAVVDLADPRLAAWAAALLRAAQISVVRGDEAGRARLLITDLRSGTHEDAWGRAERTGDATRLAVVLADEAPPIAADRTIAVGARPPVAALRSAILDAAASLGPP